MPDDLKQILSPIAGHKKAKAWNQTREKYMPVKRRQNLTNGDHFTQRNGQNNFQTVKVHFTMVMKDNNDESYNENNEQQQLTEGFAINCYKIISPNLLQKLVNDLMILPSAITIVEHFYLLKMSARILETRTTCFKKEAHFSIDQPRTCCIFIVHCFFYKNTLYKNTEVRISQKLRTF